MSTYEEMKSGGIYFCDDTELMAYQADCMEAQYDYNSTRPHEHKRRSEIMKRMFAQVGEGCYFEPPIRASWGIHTHFGKNVYANFNLTLIDDTDIYIGDNVMFAPNVVVSTAGHPILPELRERVAQFNIPIHIGSNVWIGASTVILPGVTIGDNTVIGAGSVVTRDIPANVVAVGNPCRVLREISDRDREFYFRDRTIPPEILNK